MLSYRVMLKSIFFDIYGTLAGFKPSRYEIQSKACNHFGIKVSTQGITDGYAAADEYMSQQNTRIPIRLRNQEGKNHFFAKYEQLVLKGCNVHVSSKQALKIFQHMQKIPYSLAKYPDVVKTLDELSSRGLSLGLISNLDKTGNMVVKQLGLQDYIHYPVTSQDAGFNKPHPKIFHAALNLANVHPSETVHVGDQPISDVEGALKVEIRPVLLDRDNNHKDYNICPRIRTLSELPKLLKSY